MRLGGAVNTGTGTHLERGKVNDIVNVGVLLKDLVEGSLVGHVALVKRGALAADELDAVDDFGRRVVEIVDNDDLVVCLEEGKGREGANVAGTTVRWSVSIVVVGKCMAGWRGSVPSDENRAYNHVCGSTSGECERAGESGCGRWERRGRREQALM